MAPFLCAVVRRRQFCGFRKQKEVEVDGSCAARMVIEEVRSVAALDAVISSGRRISI